MQKHFLTLFISGIHRNTGGCLFSREKAVKDVKSRVRFCFLVGVILDLDWPRKN